MDTTFTPVRRLKYVVLSWVAYEGAMRANGYFLSAAGANNLALQCNRKIFFLWIAEGGNYPLSSIHR
jgi:hypothetical protein